MEKAMDGDRLFYVMIVVIALIGVGLFAIPARAHEHGSRPLAALHHAAT
jgi:hypothetical protein